MSPQSAAASNAIGVLIADSNRMQAQLLASALRRRPEFHITNCPMDNISILQAVSLGTSPGRRSFAESARQHLSRP